MSRDAPIGRYVEVLEDLLAAEIRARARLEAVLRETEAERDALRAAAGQPPADGAD